MRWQINTRLGIWIFSVSRKQSFLWFLLTQVILKDMNMKGSVKEHYFEIEGEGKGKPNE